MKAATLCTTSKARKLIVATAIIMFGFNINLFWTIEYTVDPISGKSFFSEMERNYLLGKLFIPFSAESVFSSSYSCNWRVFS
jgi:hypothetical protein